MLIPIVPSIVLLAFSIPAKCVPQVDFDRMGKVGLAGAFAGIDILQNSSATVSFDSSTSTLLSRSSTGALTRLASTNAGGRISAGCVLSDKFYFAGSFSSIDNIPAANVASYDPSSNTFSALGSGGPDGGVDTVFCDTKDNKVWVGGHFTSPGSSVAVWDPKSRAWSPPPFVGVAGAQSRVLSITTNTSDASLFFAGSFITSFQGNGSSISNGTNNPNVPLSMGATPFSSSLVPLPLQAPQVDASPSSTDTQFSNIGNILCPSGPDGPGNTWFAADGSTPLVTIRTFSSMLANGIRLGNTFVDNHGTTGFSVVTIPDNKVQTLHYVDPSSGQTQTCSNPCPLSTDASLLYQDFLFDNTLTITGVQIKLSAFTGTAPGLHLLQLLSSGAFASSVDSNNGVSCFAPNPSNTTRNGDWEAKVADTSISGTVQTVLVSTVDIDTAPGTGPSFTWMPYVSASGNYDINLLIPGCTKLVDCPLRTLVKITVFPGEGLQPWVKDVPQQNPDDAAILIYSGPVLSSSASSVVTITMTLADQPTGSGEGGKYELVADRVQLSLKSVGNSSNNGSGGPDSDLGSRKGFGFLEWPRSMVSSTGDATKTLPKTAETFLDTLAFDLFVGTGGSNNLASTTSTVAAVVHHPSGTIFLGGNFTLTSGAVNIVAFVGGNLVNVANNGLNGPVTSLLFSGDQLFVGGSFSDTSSGSTGGKLNNIAVYDIEKKTWSTLGAGVNGDVTGLGLTNGQVQVVGKFSAAGDLGANTAGLAVWDLKTGIWVNSGGFVIGGMSFIGNGTSSQMIAGNVVASRKFGASGLVLLKNGDNNGPSVTPLGVQLGGGTTNGVNSQSNLRRRRSHVPRVTAWISHIKLSHFFSRQESPTQLSPLPTALPASGPTVFAGIFWTNTSSSTEFAIIGGSFSFLPSDSSAELKCVAIYDPVSGIIRGLQGPQINGTVRTLLVDENQLYIGGEFTIQGTTANGLAIYDLSKQQWNSNEIQPLQPMSGSTVVVRSITKSTSKTKTIIVAGSFAEAGSLRCQSICSFDTESRQWNTLGDGVQGEVTSIAYAGNNQELLIASGSIALSDNHVSNVVQFSFPNTTWNALGAPSELPGPVTAVEVNDRNANSIFAAGRSVDGSSVFLSFWDGHSWSPLSSTLQRNTTVAQLTMVPLQDKHPANGIIEQDRMLMVSGQLVDSSFGNASSALFDGQKFIPYITSTSASGTPGSVASLFRSLSSFSFSQRRFLAVGVVILISIAIAAGVVFLLALLGILWTLFSRRDDKLNKFDVTEDDDDDSTHHRPSSLLEHINAATRSTILGANPFSNDDTEKDRAAREANDPFGPDASNYIRAETPSDAVGGLMAEETSRPAHARYSFDGTGEGELPMSAGSEVEVLDDRDSSWWYARDVRTGREGVVPAAYLY